MSVSGMTPEEKPAFNEQDALSFKDELSHLINKHALENGSDTPDFLLAAFLQNVLVDLDHLMQARKRWYEN